MTIEALKAGFRKNVDVDNSKKFLTKKSFKIWRFQFFFGDCVYVVYVIYACLSHFFSLSNLSYYFFAWKKDSFKP